MSDVESWLIQYFEEHGRTGDVAPDELPHVDYIERKLLDSLAIVELLGQIEDRFGVWLEADEMEDPRFVTIEGLAAIVEEARARA